MSDDQLQDILRFDFETSPVIPIDQINDYLNSMTEEEKTLASAYLSSDGWARVQKRKNF